MLTLNIAMICRCAGSSENRIDCSSHESGYPKKKRRKDAAKAWAKLRPNDVLHQTLIAALSSHCISEDWTKDGGRYIPNAATWLNGERWQDVLMPIEQFDGSVITRGCKHCHWEALHTAPKSTDVHILVRDRKKTEDLNKLLVGSGTAASSVVHGGARARLDPAHAQRFIAITDTGDRGLIALQACQAYARGVSEIISTK